MMSSWWEQQKLDSRINELQFLGQAQKIPYSRYIPPDVPDTPLDRLRSEIDEWVKVSVT